MSWLPTTKAWCDRAGDHTMRPSCAVPREERKNACVCACCMCSAPRASAEYPLRSLADLCALAAEVLPTPQQRGCPPQVHLAAVSVELLAVPGCRTSQRPSAHTAGALALPHPRACASSVRASPSQQLPARSVRRDPLWRVHRIVATCTLGARRGDTHV